MLEDYFDIKDKKSFNEEIIFKNGIFPRAIPKPIREKDIIIGGFAVGHELMHIYHRRIIEDLLKEDPLTYDFFLEDRSLFPSIGSILPNSYGKIKRRIEGKKLSGNEDLFSCYMLITYWKRDPYLVEAIANLGNKYFAFGTLEIGMSVFLMFYPTPATYALASYFLIDGTGLLMNPFRYSFKELNKFEPRERKYLISLPSRKRPKERLKEFRKFGLDV